MRYLIKYFGIITVVFCLSVLGFLKAYLKRQSIKRLEDLYAALSRADDMLNLGISGRDEIISECFSKIDGLNFPDKAQPQLKPPGDVGETLNAFFNDFGTGDRDTERCRINRLKVRLSEFISEEKSEYARLYKIWQTAGVCAGLAVGIMLG